MATHWAGPLYVNNILVADGTNLYQNGTIVNSSAADLNTVSGMAALAGTNTANKALVVNSSNRLDNIILLGGNGSRYAFFNQTDAGNTEDRARAFAVTDATVQIISTVSIPIASAGCAIVVYTSVSNGDNTATEFAVHTACIVRLTGGNSTAGTVIKANTAVGNTANSIASTVTIATLTGGAGAIQTLDVRVTCTKTGGTINTHNLAVWYKIMNNVTGGCSMT